MTKVELFEHIRKEHFVNGKSIRQIAKELRVHRRMVRQAISSPIPPERKSVMRSTTVMTESVKYLIDEWLLADLYAPLKQRHTSRRIFTRLVEEYDFKGTEPALRRYIGKRKQTLSLRHEAFVPQIHLPGQEAEVDWYEAMITIDGELTKIYFFQMRACYSGREIHIAFNRQTQQSFLEGHVRAFNYFGGVFRVIRYDNLTSAVRKILKGRDRLQSERFSLLRSTYLFEAVFCTPGKRGSHEKGGVESGVGRYRRNHLVPVPSFSDIDELNSFNHRCCLKDDLRTVLGKEKPIHVLWEDEKSIILPLPKHDYDTDEVYSLSVNHKSYITVNTNQYSVPVELVGCTLEVRVSSENIKIRYQGKEVANHYRLHASKQVRAELKHYLSLFLKKPGAFPNSLVLQQARTNGQWPKIFDVVWKGLKIKFGENDGTRQMVDILLNHRDCSIDLLSRSLQKAYEGGSLSADSISMIIRQFTTSTEVVKPLDDIGALARYDRPIGEITQYDQLLTRRIH